MEPKGKVTIITGASEGIGKALAEALAARGAQLVLAARSEEKLKALASAIPGSLVAVTDMHDPAAIAHLIEVTVQKFGRIDLLINNAGRGLYGPLERVNLEDYEQIMDLNVFAPLRAMQLVTPIMRKNGGGMIVNISSMVSKNAYPGLGAYASTKYALNALSLTARNELAADHIVVSTFHPRMTATRFGENSAGVPLDFSGRGGVRPPVDTPEQVAEKVLDLIVSEAAEANM